MPAAPSRPAWSSELKAVWPYATSTTTLMFFIAVLTGWFVTWQTGGSSFFSYVIAAADPALAAMAMMLVCLVRPAVFSGPQFRMPHMIALPTLFMTTVLAIKLLGRDSATNVQRFENVERFDLIWLNLRMVGVVWVAMILIFALVGAFNAHPKGEGP